ncbi:HD domain-containing protein [Pedobacter sp. HDW13]|uniref:HD domain-containing protein n=1 Tax=unclassified Pedobacter TaxID=2628915 RepID=UPI000F59EF81|nr:MULTISPECIES: HD domain-containing protein [unclassified Pedobacter]QIL37810.1 HD domain-containing protein [Pedobacter sp. HDW13]RQO78971.1 phosphohydrolase [Pedobacter sp. KBW01]
MIQLNDFLYGKMELPAVFSDLLNTDVLKRLGGVHQSGAIFLVNPDICHSRLEHAIGVTLLIRMLGGSELEQIAGLLHDVSHTAFSHVGDYVFDNTDEDYHEKIFAEMLCKSEVPDVLLKYGYNISDILHGTFDILEQPLPALCADRLDYTLRDGVHGGVISRQRAREFLKSVVLNEGKIAVNDEREVTWINEAFEKLNNEMFKLPIHLYANGKMAELIKRFLNKGLLTESDLFKTDTMLLNKIRTNYEGYEAIKAIKQLRGFSEFMRYGAIPKIKARTLNAQLV